MHVDVRVRCPFGCARRCTVDILGSSRSHHLYSSRSHHCARRCTVDIRVDMHVGILVDIHTDIHTCT